MIYVRAEVEMKNPQGFNRQNNGAALHAVSSGLVFLTMNLLTGLLVGVLIARGTVIMPLKTRSEDTASIEA